MREISIKDLDLVGGGLVPPKHVYPGMSASMALRTFGGLGYVATAFTAGYSAGVWLNENTGIQGFISDLLPEPSGGNHNNVAGTNYN